VETVRVRSSANGPLAALLLESGGTSTLDGEALTVEGLSSDQIGTLAARAGITVLELSPQSASLENAYLALTRETLDYRTDDEGAA
jgi:ABC-2 type transport system ATP-binding protein